MQPAIPAAPCSAFCATCPDPAAVAVLMGKLGLALTFQMPACTFRVAPPLPAQYHFASTHAEVLYLAGSDAAEDQLSRRFPAHQSRFFAYPGRDLATYQLVLLTLFSEYGLGTGRRSRVVISYCLSQEDIMPHTVKNIRRKRAGDLSRQYHRTVTYHATCCAALRHRRSASSAFDCLCNGCYQSQSASQKRKTLMNNASIDQLNQDQQPRIMGDEYRTRFIELSTELDNDLYFHGAITITVAALQDDRIMLTRFKSAETAMNFDLSKDEFTALVSGYTAFLVDLATPGGVSTTNSDASVLDDLDKHEC